MPYTTVNFQDVEDFDALPEGEYAVEIDKVEVRQNKAGDANYLNWEFVVLDGDYENRRLWLITSLKPTALFRLKSVLEQLDLLEGEEMELEYDDDQEVTTSSGPRLIYPDVEGLEATVRVKNEIYDGKERSKVDDLFTGRKKKRTEKRSMAGDKDLQRRRRRDQDDSKKYDVDDDIEDTDTEDEEEERPRSRQRERASSRRSGNSGGRRRLR